MPKPETTDAPETAWRSLIFKRLYDCLTTRLPAPTMGLMGGRQAKNSRVGVLWAAMRDVAAHHVAGIERLHLRKAPSTSGTSPPAAWPGVIPTINKQAFVTGLKTGVKVRPTQP